MPTAHVAGSWLNESLVVVRTMDDTPSGTVHVARDDANVLRLVHEISLEGVPEQQRKSRRHEILERCEAMALLEHPMILSTVAICSTADRVLVAHEHVEGVSLLRLFGMSMNRFSERTALRWALEICDLLQYLHGRPRAMFLTSLGPRAILVTPAEKLKLLDPGLCVASGDLDTGSERGDFIRLGQLIAWLTTGSSDPAGLDTVSAECANLVRRCLADSPNDGFQDFAALRAEILRILEAPRPTRPESVGAPVASRTTPVRVSKGTWIVTGVAAILALTLVPVMLARWVSERPFVREGPGLFVVTAQELRLLEPATLREIGRREFRDASLSAVRYNPSRNLLILADRRKGRLFFLDASSGVRQGVLNVDNDPRNLVVLPEQPRMFCSHGASRGISDIALDRRRVTAIYSMPSTPTGMTATPDGSLLYVACGSEKSIHVLETRTGRIVRSVALDAPPGAMSLSRDRSTLWICFPRADEVRAIHLDAAGLPDSTPATVVSDLTGTRPVGIAVPPDGKGMVVLCQDSASISAISSVDGTATVRMGTNGLDPVCWTWTQGSDSTWVGNQKSRNLVRLGTASGSGSTSLSLSHPPRDLVLAP